jgi:hypothetical protein
VSAAFCRGRFWKPAKLSAVSLGRSPKDASDPLKICDPLPREHRNAPSRPPFLSRPPCPKHGPVRRPCVASPMRCGSRLTGAAPVGQACPFGSHFSPPGKLRHFIWLCMAASIGANHCSSGVASVFTWYRH